MDTLELILAELQKTPSIFNIETQVNGSDCTFTIYQVIPCSPDIYCVFVNPTTGAYYALQNTGSMFWVKWSNGLIDDKYFLLPVTSFLIKDHKECLNTFVKWCRQSELGGVATVKEEFSNPFA